MRFLPLLPLLVVTLAPSATRAQSPSTVTVPNPGSRCFRLAADRPVPGDGEVVEFILAPSASGHEELQPWTLRGPVRGDRAALWWPGGDGLAAALLDDDGSLWALDVDPAPEVMVGRMWRVFPHPGDTTAIRATPADCLQGRRGE